MTSSSPTLITNEQRVVDSITASLAIIGDRWSLLIVRGIFRGLRRFGELREDLGIASNLLTTRLTRLEDEGIVERRQYQDRPARFEYHLTDAGIALSPVLIAIMQWGDVYRTDADTPVLVHDSCQAPVSNQTVCSSCHEVVDPRNIRRMPADQTFGTHNMADVNV